RSSAADYSVAKAREERAARVSWLKGIRDECSAFRELTPPAPPRESSKRDESTTRPVSLLSLALFRRRLNHRRGARSRERFPRPVRRRGTVPPSWRRCFPSERWALAPDPSGQGGS